jgi:hypothetical protein
MVASVIGRRYGGRSRLSPIAPAKTGLPETSSSDMRKLRLDGHSDKGMSALPPSNFANARVMLLLGRPVAYKHNARFGWRRRAARRYA